jgi:hypothetical protein
MSDTSLYFISLTGTSILAGMVLLILKRKLVLTYVPILAMGLLLMVTSFYGIVKPSTFYPHYFLLFFIPLIFVFGISMGLFQKAFNQHKIYPFISAFFISVTILLPAAYGYEKAYSVTSEFSSSGILKKEAAAEFISRYAFPGEKMAIWGWKTDLYIQTGLTLGTRYGDSFHQLTKTNLQPYYISNYLLDLKSNKPKIFVDAITPRSFFFNEINDRHENYSEIDTYIKGNYKKIGEIDQIRIYIRD